VMASFQECIVMHLKRNSNRVADTPAKLANSYGNRVMLHDYPPLVRELVMSDTVPVFPT
jgi:hypothetical protein